MLNIGMIDDEEASLEMAKGAFKAFFSAKNIDVNIKAYKDPMIFLDSMNEIQYDLICSDIIMDKMDGIELAKKIKIKDKSVSMIFISSNENKVFSCFDYDPIGFIRKTNFFADTQSVMSHFINDILPSKKKVQKLEVKSKGETILLNLDDIIYIEGNHNYQSFYLKDKKEPIEVRKLIGDLEKELSPYGFIRVHKGFLVNYKYVYKFSSSFLTLNDGKEIPISRQNRDDIIKKYMMLTSESVI